MKAIRQRNYYFAASTGLGIMISVLILTCGILMPEIQSRMLLTVTVVASGFMAGLWMREYKRLKTKMATLSFSIPTRTDSRTRKKE